jgi:error-prone DNA polymerase
VDGNADQRWKGPGEQPLVRHRPAGLWATDSSPGTHPVQHIRGHLTACGALPAATVRAVPDGTPITVGGLVARRLEPLTVATAPLGRALAP